MSWGASSEASWEGGLSGKTGSRRGAQPVRGDRQPWRGGRAELGGTGRPQGAGGILCDASQALTAWLWAENVGRSNGILGPSGSWLMNGTRGLEGNGSGRREDGSLSSKIGRAACA